MPHSQKEYVVIWKASKPGRRRRTFTIDRAKDSRSALNHAGLPDDRQAEFYKDALKDSRADQSGLC